MTAPKAIVIGGGIGGLAAAVALPKVGMAVTVFERAPAIREVGAGLSLWSNAVTALRRLGLESRIVELGSPVERMQTVTASGQVLSEITIEELSRKAGAPSLCVHRADLLRTLAEALELSVIRTNARCVGFEQHSDVVTARFADGQSESGDLLLGADGIQSAIRAQLFGPSEPRYAGYTCWRGIAHFEHPDLPSGLSLFALGRGTQMGLSHCGPARIYWFVTQNAPAGTADPPGGHKHAVLTAFTGWHPMFRAVIEATDESAILKNDIIDRPPIRIWGVGRLTLLGDAAHPSTPNLGQGACQALEDAVVLADCLRQADGVISGLRSYEERRRRRTAWVTTQSWFLGKVFQWQNPIAIWLRNRSFRTKWGHRQALKLFENLVTYKVPQLLGA
jgi:2-polyprenyl-6-methoxyphenol hydroxylase-like FAD-dependent oxidoreductase